VNDDQDKYFPGLPRDVFARQMEILASRWHVCSMSEAIERMAFDDVPENAVVITFDDGYRDNYVHAFPVLQQFSLPATIYLATGVIGNNGKLWHDRVFDLFRMTTVASLDGIPTHSDRFDLGTVEDKRRALAAILHWLWELSPSERGASIDRLRDALAVPDDPGTTTLMLTWEDVRLMHQSGVSFGSHTVTHPILSRLTTEQAAAELQESKQAIEDALQVPIEHFAYPVGRRQDFSQKTKELVRSAGYKSAVTTIRGSNTPDTDLLELRRVIPWSEDIAAFSLNLQYLKFVS
jgi:peptidoglycan/xylan/chitin deacetylase (PgdA/CDA1 family)